MKFAVLRLLRQFGYDVQKYGPHRDPLRRFQQALARHNARIVLDVGANVGQFAKRLRINGYHDRIISFEPLSGAHAKLMAAAKGDPQWTVASRCAVGASCGVIEINIAANSQSSSVLTMLDRHLAGDPKSGYIGKESVELITLDAFLDKGPQLTTTPMGLKVDTQGYEAEVMSGLDRWGESIKVMQIEMSLAPLYDRSLGFVDLYRLMQDRGYRCISIEPNFIDTHTYEVLQTDAVFER